MRHPRLYLNSEIKDRLADQTDERFAAMVINLKESADWCLEQAPRNQWIAPQVPDPIHENLYDRFYAIMKDLAITEHLALAYGVTGETVYGEAARDWVLASCRVWQDEASGEVDGGKAYAVSRLLKGIAVGYDMAFNLLSDQEADEIRNTVARIGSKYFDEYFNTTDKTGPDFHTHHATVEWASIGVAALAFLDAIPEATDWLSATIRKFKDHLLPMGLTDDGAHIEGATFWASTMQYRLFFMDALKNVTGEDLFTPYGRYMRTEPALAAITGYHTRPQGPCNDSLALQPSYGQLDYCSAVLLCLARYYRNPLYQQLALWDRTIGHIQKTRYVTPNGEQMLFELGGYSCVWFDPDLSESPSAEEQPLSWAFPSVQEAYARISWEPNGFLTAMRGQQLLVHCGSHTVLNGDISGKTPENPIAPVLGQDDTVGTVLHWNNEDESVDVALAPRGKCTVTRCSTEVWKWTCQGDPELVPGGLTWEGGIQLSIVRGEITAWHPHGYQEEMVVGNGLLVLDDPAPATESCMTIQPDTDGQIVIAVTLPDH